MTHFDARSTTDTFQLNERDMNYSVFRPDLAALKTVDGRPASGLPQDNDDALSRRDMGLEFLDVTSRVNIALIDARRDVAMMTTVHAMRAAWEDRMGDGQAKNNASTGLPTTARLRWTRICS
jgi:hypothetical protein